MKKVKMAHSGKLVGKYIALWRMHRLQVCRVISTKEAKFEIGYEIITGPDKRKRMMTHYDPAQTVNAFSDKKSALAYMEKERQRRRELDEKDRREWLRRDIKSAMDILKGCLLRLRGPK